MKARPESGEVVPNIPTLQVNSVREIYASPEFIALVAELDAFGKTLHPAYRAFAAREMLLAAICQMATSPESAITGAEAFAGDLIDDAAASWLHLYGEGGGRA
jgi:hypothetical protein